MSQNNDDVSWRPYEPHGKLRVGDQISIIGHQEIEQSAVSSECDVQWAAVVPTGPLFANCTPVLPVAT